MGTQHQKYELHAYVYEEAYTNGINFIRWNLMMLIMAMGLQRGPKRALNCMQMLINDFWQTARK
jgi:hypothetical protein